MTEQKPGYGHAYDRLRDLGPEKLAALEGRMAMGEPSHSLADLIQKIWGLFPEIQRKTLARQLARYRNVNVTPKLAVVYEAVAGKAAAEKAKVILYQDLDILEEMRDLMELQKTRVLRLIEQEAKTPLLISSKEIDGAIEGLRKIQSDLAHVLMQTGKLRVAQRGVKGEVVNADGTRTAFAYVVAEADAQVLSDQAQSYIEEVEQRLVRARQLRAHAPAIEYLPTDHRPS
jgi:hypothetical protein